MSGLNRTVIFLFIAVLLSACKKGENDPFLSLNSRKGRMHGDWNISALEYKERTTNTDGDYLEVIRNYQNGLITQITTSHVEVGGVVDEVDTMLIALEYVKISFDRNGTWSSEFDMITTWTDFESGGGSYEFDTVITVLHIKESGDWSFLGAVKDEFKNKERFVMNTLTSEKAEQITSTYTEISPNDTIHNVNIGAHITNLQYYYSGESSTIIEIDQLKKKEMVFIEKRRQSGASTIIPYQGISTTSENDEFYSDLKVTLSRL